MYLEKLKFLEPYIQERSHSSKNHTVTKIPSTIYDNYKNEEYITENMHAEYDRDNIAFNEEDDSNGLIIADDIKKEIDIEEYSPEYLVADSSSSKDNLENSFDYRYSEKNNTGDVSKKITNNTKHDSLLPSTSSNNTDINDKTSNLSTEQTPVKRTERFSDMLDEAMSLYFSQRSNESKPLKSANEMFFQSLLPDLEKLNQEDQRDFKLKTMQLLHEKLKKY